MEDKELRKRIAKINRLTDYTYAPKNMVLVSVEDIIEMFHEIQPYTMAKLDELSERDERREAEIRIDEQKRTELYTYEDGYTAIRVLHPTQQYMTQDIRIAELEQSLKQSTGDSHA